MKVEYAIDLFLDRESGGCSDTLRSFGNKLISYETCIAQWVDGEVIVNSTSYSVTTSKYKNKLVNRLKEEGIRYRLLYNLPIGILSLNNIGE